MNITRSSQAVAGLKAKAEKAIATAAGQYIGSERLNSVALRMFEHPDVMAYITLGLDTPAATIRLQQVSKAISKRLKEIIDALPVES